jgi:Molecular chaperone GrpE (heat shock protein)
MPKVEVAFDIDANGIINVTAKDEGTGNEQQIRIEGGSGLKQEEIDQMIKEAETHAGEAHKLRELVDARNQAEALAYQIEKSVQEHREKLDAGLASTVEGRIMELRAVLDSSDLAEITAKSDALQEAWTQAAQALYAQASSEQPVRRRRRRVRRRGRGGRRVRGRRRQVTDDRITEETEAVDELAVVSKERDEYLDALQRLKAEFDNYRKRVARDQRELAARAHERLMRELLPVLDDLERALDAANEHEEAKLDEGIRLVQRHLADLLAREGLVEVPTEGAFDPHSQEALLAQPSDAEEGTVIQVLQKGYKLGDHVLRPARVVISQGNGERA